jgi:type IV pilus assembly protein PilE
MMQVAQEQERYYTMNNQYNIGATQVSPLGATGTSILYNITVASGTAPAGFQVNAVPANSQSPDTQCGTLTLDALGIKGLAAPTPPPIAGSKSAAAPGALFLRRHAA